MISLAPLTLIAVAISFGLIGVHAAPNFSNESIFILNVVIAQALLIFWAVGTKSYHRLKLQNQKTYLPHSAAPFNRSFVLLLLALWLLTTAAMAGVLTIRTVVSLSGSTPTIQAIKEFAQTLQNSWSVNLIFVTCVVAPIVEEFAFRRTVFDAAHDELGVLMCVVCSSILFALTHVSISLWIAVLIGLGASVLYARTASLLLCVLFHASLNLVHSSIFSRAYTWELIAQVTNNLASSRTLVAPMLGVIIAWILILILIYKHPVNTTKRSMMT
jgi:membrane protease YdiL (CAAX protease family)